MISSAPTILQYSGCDKKSDGSESSESPSLCWALIVSSHLPEKFVRFL